ncbi:MAG: MBL fold metallo-hydrolase [Planctomycetota bacterium]
MRKLLLVGAALALLAFAIDRHQARLARATPAGLTALAAGNPPAAPGTFPEQWIHGADCEGDPQFQVHAYNQNLFILRQSKCETFEAPFLYLIFGEDVILLLDTGANPSSDLFGRVGNLIRRWRADTGNQTAQLLVAHTHGHFDHVQGDAQMANFPGLVAPVGIDLTQNGFEAFWGFQDYPNDRPTIDLGGRVLDVIGVPGHFGRSVALYDRQTQLLLTGDIVYPGHLFVFGPNSWPDFVASIQRLVDFASQNPVEAVVGCHVEYSTTPGVPYAYTTDFQPDELPVQFPPSILAEVLAAALEQNGDPECTIYPQFVIHPVYKCGITWNG